MLATGKGTFSPEKDGNPRPVTLTALQERRNGVLYYGLPVPPGEKIGAVGDGPPGRYFARPLEGEEEQLGGEEQLAGLSLWDEEVAGQGQQMAAFRMQLEKMQHDSQADRERLQREIQQVQHDSQAGRERLQRQIEGVQAELEGVKEELGWMEAICPTLQETNFLLSCREMGTVRTLLPLYHGELH
jgi:hypothetical protein